MATERNNNQVPTLLAKSNAADDATVIVWADPTTRRLLVDVAGGGTSMTDDAAFTPGTTAGTPAFATFDDVAPDSVDEGDGGAIRMSANRNLYVRIRDNAGNERGLNVDANGAIAVTGGGGGTQFADGAARGTATGTIAMVDDGTNIQSLLGDTSGRAFINVSQINGVAPLMGSGATGTGSPRISIATDANVVDTELPAAAALADAASAAPSTSTIGSIPLLMNATTVDRQRAVVNALDSVGTGIAAVGLVGQLDDTATGTVTENQFAPLRISTRRALLVEGVASGTNINVAVNAALPTGSNVIGALSANQSVNVAQINGVTPLMGNGVTGTGSQRVTIASDNTAFAVNATLSAETTKVIGTVNVAAGQSIAVTQATASSLNAQVVGGIAHDAADSGNPVKIGTRVERTAVAEMADADRSDVLSDNFGSIYTSLGNRLTYASIDKTTTASQDVVAAPGAGNHLRIYGYTISNEGTESVTATITSVAVHRTGTDGNIAVHLPGYIDLATNTASTATLSGTSTNGVVIGVWYRTMAD